MDNEKKAWLEVSLQCSGELAEAVAEVLARFCPEGVVLDSITRYDAEKHEHIPTGMMRVAAYLPQDSELENKKRSLEEALWYMGRIVPLAAPEFVSIEDQDWMTVWKQNYQPLRIGENWLILPAWLESPAGETRQVVRIDPAMAFGTGTHPSTQLCLLGVEDFARGADTVIDLGCGSGILSIAALKLGVRRALAVDIDEQAVAATLNNARINGIGSELEASQGSLADILAGKYAFNQRLWCSPTSWRRSSSAFLMKASPGWSLQAEDGSGGNPGKSSGDVLAAARAVGMDLIVSISRKLGGSGSRLIPAAPVNEHDPSSNPGGMGCLKPQSLYTSVKQKEARMAVITMSRELGTGGGLISQMVTNSLNYKLVDKELIAKSCRSLACFRLYRSTIPPTTSGRCLTAITATG